MEKSVSPVVRVVIAAASFVFGCVLLYTVGSRIQYELGIWGVAVTELMILVIAIVSILIARMDLEVETPDDPGVDSPSPGTAALDGCSVSAPQC